VAGTAIRSPPSMLCRARVCAMTSSVSAPSGNKYTATSSMTRGVRALGKPLVERTLEKVRVNPSSGHASETASTEDLRVAF
jgi:hypothetical protein